MPRNSRPGSAEPIARDVRQLPSRPSLEYERKQAKTLLRQIRAGEPNAVRHVEAVHAAALRHRPPAEFKLTDAQHVIAREYGFSSWPRLLEYFEEMERHRNAPRFGIPANSPDHLKESASWMIQRHARGDQIVARMSSHFVPRFYKRSMAEILTTPMTEDDAQLIVARGLRHASWEEAVERTSADRQWMDARVWQRENSPLSRAHAAIRGEDVDGLASILDDHPELLTPPAADRARQTSLADYALDIERKSNTEAARRLTDLLAARGVDIQRELDETLLARVPRQMKPEDWRWFLDRGANPNWLPPSGISVLEHAILLYRNAAAVDLIAERVHPPRRALWIAAGLGDVEGVRTFIAGKGKLTSEGRLNRPDLMAMGDPGGMPPHFEADDIEIMWEAFRVAGLNSRWPVMDLLLDAGVPVDHSPLIMPLVIEAATHMMVPLVEYLVGHGADTTTPCGYPVNGSVRTIVRGQAVHNPKDENAIRLLEICKAGTVKEILAEIDATRPSPPPLEARVGRIMQLAADDAARQGQSAVTTENMVIGVLRLSKGDVASVFSGPEHILSKLRDRIGDRLLPDTDPLLGQDLPLDTDADAAMSLAIDEADSQRYPETTLLHLMRGIFEQETGSAVRLLDDVGAHWRGLQERLRKMAE